MFKKKIVSAIIIIIIIMTITTISSCGQIASYVISSQEDEKFITAYEFSEGRAWVKYVTPTEKEITALIDTQGNIIWKTDPSDGNVIGTGPSNFKDGLSYLRYSDRVSIIDSNGNVTFTKEKSEQEKFEILGYGNGQFLIAEYISNFDTNEWRIGTIDKNGNIVVPMKVYKARDINGNFIELRFDRESILPFCEYYGENIFNLRFWEPVWEHNLNIFLNVETQNVITDRIFSGGIDDIFGVAYNFCTKFENGYAIVQYFTPKDDKSNPEYIK